MGCNYIPSNAVNQLEMWQAETFDLAIIKREIGWAANLGFTSVRVFLHDLLWAQDAHGFTDRVDAFLDVLHAHKMGALLVLFDSVWHPQPHLGPQPPPKPFVHNPGWVQSPGAALLQASRAQQRVLLQYAKGIVSHFRNDKRVHGWDVWNEPDNTNSGSYGDLEPKDKAGLVYPLLQEVFLSARAAKPTQPLTSGLWDGNWKSAGTLQPLETLMVKNSDVISFHSYGKPQALEQKINELRAWKRPLLCTEFMARPEGSTFEPCLEILKHNNVGAYCWGFVSGKTQTIYPWDSWKRPYRELPKQWFHDVLNADGTPYDPAEVTYIKRVTAKG